PAPRGPSQPGHHGAGQRPGRVKRRKTKRERNSAKFGRNAAGRPGCRMPQRMPALAIKRVSGCMPVIITQHRLSQHLGMFNREVKSADIERLLDPRSKPETETKTSAVIPGAISQAWDPCAPGQTSPLDEKENVPPSGAEPGGATAAMKELAQELQTHLDLTSTFPGRNLISERRQTVLSTLLDRHQTLPDLSALMVHNKLCGGSAPPKLLCPRPSESYGQPCHPRPDFSHLLSGHPTPLSLSVPVPVGHEGPVLQGAGCGPLYFNSSSLGSVPQSWGTSPAALPSIRPPHLPMAVSLVCIPGPPQRWVQRLCSLGLGGPIGAFPPRGGCSDSVVQGCGGQLVHFPPEADAATLRFGAGGGGADLYSEEASGPHCV
uniref:Uncharacterized protein n=1 Tax=Gopherus agassizii TaxID=38772 RepID=A0A452HTA6_9SAUR